MNWKKISSCINKKPTTNMRVNRKIKMKIMLSLLFFLIMSPLQLCAEDEYLVISVIDASFPPRFRIYEELNFTRFSFDIDYQVNNPTHSDVVITFICTPFPFPRLKVNLENKTLLVLQAFIIEPFPGEYILSPGIWYESYLFSFEIDNYLNESPPLGEYEMWFDYTNCSTCPVPVVTEKLIIDVTETNIIYFFENNNETRVVSPTQTIEVADFELPFYVFSLLLLVRVYVKRKRRTRV
ncbi:MAG: hypothetical protein HGN29_05680 [Asgard group archaeon]|nr:hypothetical protein [Asgard group archaeon]